jgi:hypothetical protein
VRDSLVAYQALNDPRLSPLGIGGNDNASFTVSGGNGTLSYSVTGSASNNAGYLHLPSAVAQLFDSVHGFAAPTWMKNPDVYANYGGSSSLTAQIGNAGATITLNSQLFHSDQQQSSLQSILGLLQYSYIGSGAVAAQALVNNFPNFFERAQLNTMTFNNSLSLTNWAPWHWLPIQATAGLSVSNTDNNALMPRDYAFSGFDTIGRYAITRGSNVTQSLMAGTNLLGSRLVSTAIGINVYASQNTNFGASTIGLPIGVTAPTSFLYTNSGPSNSQFNSATYGWYVQPTLNLNSRFFASPGFRLDGGSASGIHSGVSGGALSLFPKLDLSYVAVNRPPSDPMWGMITLLRPRIAFGVAGVQPGPAMKLRLLNPSLNLPIDTTGTATPVSLLYYQTLGNTQLHPERSREVEGGADIQFWNNRLSLILTGYHKMRYDAIENISAAPSTSTNDGNNNFYFANIGTIRNTGLEATVSALLIDSRVMQWSINGNVSHNDNIFVSSNFGGSPVFANAFQSGIIVQSVPGFPVNGLWAKPILGFGDSNGDGMIEPNEVRLGDSLAYIGASLPNYELTLNTTLSFFNNRLSVSTSIDYQNGLTQTNGSTGRSANDLLFNDPSITLSREAAIAAQFAIPNTLIGMAQTVNTLRWTSLSVNYLVPPNVSHLFRVPSLSLALQGSNLGLHTNYRGKDPNVNAFSGGNTTQDAGQLPLPRLWRVSVRIGN